MDIIFVLFVFLFIDENIWKKGVCFVEKNVFEVLIIL